MTDEEIAARTLQHGLEFKYAHGFEPRDEADRAALGICADLCDRRGIKHEMGAVDDDVRADIVRALAAIIRAAYGVTVGAPTPLTDERIGQLFADHDECKTYRDGINFARAVLRASGVDVPLKGRQ
jgi:Arc/MetJ family transcription regulator